MVTTIEATARQIDSETGKSPASKKHMDFLEIESKFRKKAKKLYGNDRKDWLRYAQIEAMKEWMKNHKF